MLFAVVLCGSAREARADYLFMPFIGTTFARQTTFFTGTALFVGTGMITAFIWPMLAREAPAAVGVDGAVFLPPAVAVFALTALTLVAGYLGFGLASWRIGVLPRWALACWAIGGSLGMVPPEPLGPMPWPGLVLSGLVFGLGAAGLGAFLWRHPTDEVGE